MSQHPSLKSNEWGKKNQSVLKRLERLIQLKKQDKWKEGDSVFGLQKVKILKFKVKKEKKEAAVEGAAPVEGAPGAAAPAPGAAAPEAAKTQKTTEKPSKK
ncbi:MAG: small basic protein [Candidatus Omnitrophota bacterium]